MPVRNVQFYICRQWDFQLWLLQAEAKCDAYNFLEEEYQKKWNAENNKLPEPLMSKALRKAAKKSGEASRESACSVYLKLFDRFMC
jgi:hypothetical protein